MLPVQAQPFTRRPYTETNGRKQNGFKRPPLSRVPSVEEPIENVGAQEPINQPSFDQFNQRFDDDEEKI